MNSLGTRLAVIISSVLFVLMALTVLFIDRRLAQAIHQEEVNQAATHARTMLASLQTLMLNGKGTLAREWLDRMNEEQGIVEIEVIRKDGNEAFTDITTVQKVNNFIQQERFSREPSKPHSLASPSMDTFASALNGETVFDRSELGTMVTVYMPIEKNTECFACHGYDPSPMAGVLKLSLSTAAATHRIEAMRLNLWGIAALLVVLLGTTLWLVLRYNVLHPIAQLRSAITRVGQGDRTAKLPIVRNDELGMVSAVFNRMQDQLLASETRIRAVMDNVVDAIITIDEKGIIESVNPAAEKMFGYSEQELIGQKVNILMPEPYGNAHDEYIERYQRTGNASILGVGRELVGMNKDGSIFPMDIAVSEMVLGNERRYIGIARDITDRKRHMAELEYQALHDSLTGLPNRILLLDRLQQGIRTARREKKTLALLIMDLDRFKEINDTLGHHIGDLLLQEVARRMQSVLRGSDTVARLGGDEFSVLLPTADIEQATQISEKILSKISQSFNLDGHRLQIGASIGLAMYPDHGDDDITLMRRADVAMYVAKRSQCGYMVYEAKHDADSLHNLSLMNDLRRAIENDELTMCYQPVIDFKTGRINGVEALARWQHPKKGLLYPDEFIPIAEQKGLISSISLWVLDNVSRQNQNWLKLGIELRISVNLSVNNLHDVNFPAQVAQIIEVNNLEPSRLRLEITETAIMSDTQRALDILNHLSSLGVRLSVDDFGTGYSSLSYLKKLPVDEIKIDKSFIMGMLDDENDAVIVRSTIDLAHNIGLKVVAEGVENQKTYDLLSGLYCDMAQGYHMAMPMSSDELIVWFNESSWGQSQDDKKQ